GGSRSSPASGRIARLATQAGRSHPTPGPCQRREGFGRPSRDDSSYALRPCSQPIAEILRRAFKPFARTGRVTCIARPIGATKSPFEGAGSGPTPPRATPRTPPRSGLRSAAFHRRLRQDGPRLVGRRNAQYNLPPLPPGPPGEGGRGGEGKPLGQDDPKGDELL